MGSRSGGGRDAEITILQAATHILWALHTASALEYGVKFLLLPISTPPHLLSLLF